MPADSLNIFASFTHEDQAPRAELAKHLRLLKRQGLIEDGYDRHITVGQEWGEDRAHQCRGQLSGWGQPCVAEFGYEVNGS